MLRINELAGFGGGGVVKDMTYGGTYSAASSVTSHSHAGCNLGNGDSSRIVVIGILVRGVINPPTISNVVIAGVSATGILTHDNGRMSISLYAAKVPSGATGTITYTTSASSPSIITVHSMYGIDSVTPTLTDTVVDASTDLSNNVLSGDILLGVGGGRDGTGNTTWTGLTEDSDTNLDYDGGAVVLFTSAHYKTLAAESPRTLTCALPGLSNRLAVLSLWR
jgi:hypothetical protein